MGANGRLTVAAWILAGSYGLDHLNNTSGNRVFDCSTLYVDATLQEPLIPERRSGKSQQPTSTSCSLPTRFAL